LNYKRHIASENILSSVPPPPLHNYFKKMSGTQCPHKSLDQRNLGTASHVYLTSQGSRMMGGGGEAKMGGGSSGGEEEGRQRGREEVERGGEEKGRQ
jgi:hypothetical protein